MSKDPYTQKVRRRRDLELTRQASEDASLDTKVSEVKSIIKTVKTGMLTLASSDGTLHSRAMAPADFDDLSFSFIANRSVRFTSVVLTCSASLVRRRTFRTTARPTCRSTSACTSSRLQ